MFHILPRISGLALLLGIAAAIAQDSPRPVGPGGFGPPGGGGRFGFGPPLPPNSAGALLGMPEVRGELGIKDKQAESVDTLLEEVRERSRAAMGTINFQEIQNLTPEERDARFAEIRRKTETANREYDEKLSKLLDARQTERLAQLKLQREGAAVFQRKDVADKLALSEEQREKIRKLSEMSTGGFPPPSPEDQKKAQDEAVALLSADQKSKWQELIGAEFRFPARGMFGGPGFGGPGGPGGFGPGGPMGGERKIVKQFDKDGDGRLNTEERRAARESLKENGGGRRGGPGGGGFGGPGGPGGRGNRETPKPGPKVAPSDVKSVPEDVSLYDATVVRTLFLTFENDDWEKEMAEFKGTDVEMPATLVVDGKTYPEVGVHFRGMSSFGMIGEGSKRSLNVSLDYVNNDQRLLGYKTLNLLNSHGDPSFLHSILFSHISRQHIPAPKANLVKVVINGESWGVYVNVQQFDKIFLRENYPSAKGTRWKVPGRPGGRGGLEYLGENIDDYKRLYEMKTDDGDKAWKALIALCRTIKETPADDLENALEPILDLDGVLWFLALDVALVNEDGYWTRASDYSIFLDDKGKFHLIPHDMNETFHAGGFGPGGGGPGGPMEFGPGAGPGGPMPFGPGGRGPFSGPPGGGPGAGPGIPGGGPERGPRGPNERAENDRRPEDRGPRGGGPGGPGRGGPGGGGREGMGGGPRGGGTELDPLVALNDTSKPLRSKLLAVPALRTRYLKYVHTIAQESLDWKTLGPIVQKYEKLIAKDVQADTRKLSTYAAFQAAVSNQTTTAGNGQARGASLRSFADQRRKYLLSHTEVKKAARSSDESASRTKSRE